MSAVTKKLTKQEAPLWQDLAEGVDDDEWVGILTPPLPNNLVFLNKNLAFCCFSIPYAINLKIVVLF